MGDITQFPQRDLITEMMGPPKTGHAVAIDGQVVPNLVMNDKGDEIEFVLDNRLAFIFPRDVAYLAASFAFSAMAIGAGFPHQSATHFTQRPFAPTVVNVGEPK